MNYVRDDDYVFGFDSPVAYDPMGANIFQKIFPKTAKKLRALKAKASGLKISLPGTEASFGPSGLSVSSGAAPAIPETPGAGGIIDMVKQNPLLLAIPAVGIFLILSRKKK